AARCVSFRHEPHPPAAPADPRPPAPGHRRRTPRPGPLLADHHPPRPVGRPARGRRHRGRRHVRAGVLSRPGPGRTARNPLADPSAAAAALGSEDSASRLSDAMDLLSQDLAALQRHLPRGGGSNNWVIAGRRTTTGKPLLASDPHLAPTAPPPWYLIHLRTPE